MASRAMNEKYWIGQKVAIAVIMLTGATALAQVDNSWDINIPHGESKQLSIDVTEGTWMNLDVSPDGRSLVFDLLGDIYWLPITGGEAKSITHGLAWDMQPRFSPDGTHIAFTSDRGGADNIWTVKNDGSRLSQITFETFQLVNNASWSADGRFLAARKHFTTERSLGAGEVWLYDLNGGDGFPVVERPSVAHQKELGEPAFSMDGRYLYYSRDTTPGPVFEYAQDSNGEIFGIFRYDMQARVEKPVVSGAGGAVRPTPSPDGRYLAFVRRIRTKSALFLKNLESGTERLLHTDLDQDLQEVWAIHGVSPNIAWTPDSKFIVFWAGGHIRKLNIESKEFDEIPFHVSDKRTTVTAIRPQRPVAPDNVTIKMVRDAKVSPDGSAVVFEAAGRLYTKTLPNGDTQALTSDSAGRFEFQPSWSPNGRSIIFVSWNDKELGAINEVRSTGGNSRTLTTTPGHYRNPQFSPDGDQIVFQQTTGGYLTSSDWATHPGIYVMPAAGGQATLVAESGRNAHFGARNDRVFFTRASDKGNDLVSTSISGANELVHLTSDSVSQYVVSPDNLNIAFREYFDIYAMPMPPAGRALHVSSSSESVRTIRTSGDGGDYPHWSNDGKSLHWTLGPMLFGSNVEAALARATAEDHADDEFYSPTAIASLSFQMPADKPVGKIALTNARIITMADEGTPVIQVGTVLLDGNRIVAVGADGTVDVPPNATVVNLAGKTIIPGLIDAHAHTPQGSGITPQQNWANYATLAFGVTTIHDPGNVSTEIFTASEMQRVGTILGPRMFSAGNVLYGARSPDLFAEINSLDDARRHVRRLKSQGAHSIKNYNQPRREQRQQIVTAALEENILVVAEGASLINLDLSMVADGNAGIEHNLPQSNLYDDVTQFWSQTNVSYTPTLVVSFGGLSAEQYWYQESNVWEHPILKQFVPPGILQPRAVRRQMAPLADYHHLRSAATAKLMSDNGITVSVGGHGQREGLASHWEMWSLVQGGMSPFEALRAATINPARHLGLDADLGSIEAGKLADLVILDSNPLDNIRDSDKVALVVLNGRMYDASTLNERISGTRTTLPFYWQQ